MALSQPGANERTGPQRKDEGRTACVRVAPMSRQIGRSR
jgi:hypothetical protein